MIRRGLAAVAVSAIAALSSGVSTAHAAPPNPPVVSKFSISVAFTTVNNQPTNPPLLSGQFDVDESGASAAATATMSWTGPDPAHHPTFKAQDVCPGAECKPDGNGHYTITSYPLPSAAYNGPYHVDATANATDPVWGKSNDAKASTDFAVVVPPPDVTGVTAAVDKQNRSTIVSWDRDATTPDIQAYFIWRKGPDDKDFRAIAQTPQLDNGARVTVIDFDTANRGGDYVYEIETRRNGPSGDSTSYVPSDRSKSMSNKVTVPNPPPGATTTPTTAPRGNGPPPVLKGTPSGVNRNSGFSGSNFGSPSASPSTTESVTPDPGFVRGLPDAGENPGADGEGDNSAVAVTPGRHSSSNGRGYLVPVAGGAVLFLGALHLRLFKKRLDEPIGLG